jgi:Uma2 family endonuclease
VLLLAAAVVPKAPPPRFTRPIPKHFQGILQEHVPKLLLWRCLINAQGINDYDIVAQKSDRQGRSWHMGTDLAEKHDAYTYEDYANFPDDLRCEIIDGRIYVMTPSPTTTHQSIALRLGRLVDQHLESEGYPCRIYIAPVDVVLSEKDVVQPDAFVICDRSKIKKRGVFGAPNVVFEVISPSTEAKDRKKKRDLFEQYGVKEYFMVHPDGRFVEKYTLDTGVYKKSDIYEAQDTFRIETIKLEICLKDLFNFPMEDESEA